MTKQETKRYDYILEQYPVVALSEEINATIKEITSRYDKGQLPPKIRPTLIKELLSEHECICGNEILEGSYEFEKLKNLQNVIAMSSIDTLSQELKFELGYIENNDTVSFELDQFLKRNLNFDKKKKGLDLQFELNQNKLKQYPKKDIKEIIEKKDKKEKERDKLQNKIGSLENQKADSIATLQKLNREFDSTMRKNKQNSYVIKKIDWCKKAIKYLENIKNTLLLEVKNNVQKSTTDNFLKLVWKKKTFDKVEIDSEYEIRVHHLDGRWILNSLSKGEKLVLAMSFVAALRNVTKLQFPLVIDTPLGRVDGEPRANIAKYLPEFLEKQQVTMLMTYSEYANKIEDKDLKKSFEPFRDIIVAKVGKEIVLEYNDDMRCTKIK